MLGCQLISKDRPPGHHPPCKSANHYRFSPAPEQVSTLSEPLDLPMTLNMETFRTQWTPYLTPEPQLMGCVHLHPFHCLFIFNFITRIYSMWLGGDTHAMADAGEQAAPRCQFSPSAHCMDPGDQTQETSLGNKHLYPLSHCPFISWFLKAQC